MPSVNLMTSLREATREIHRRIEQLPFARALAQRRLPSMSYVGYLRVFAAIHGMIERELPRSSDARVAAMWSDDLRRSHLLQQDLDYFLVFATWNTRRGDGRGQGGRGSGPTLP